MIRLVKRLYRWIKRRFVHYGKGGVTGDQFAKMVRDNFKPTDKQSALWKEFKDDVD